MTNQKQFVASAEAKGKAKQLRLFALLAWVIAIGGEVFAILKLIHDDMLVWLIVAIVAILGLTITGSLLWKKANRLDPASEKDKFKFFVQNQLGAIIAVLAFLPLVIFILSNKEIDGKTKGIAGAIAGVALLAATIFGIDFNPPSIEKYTEEINAQTEVVTSLTDTDQVYWARQGTVNHIYEDCQHIRGRDGVTFGTVKESFEAKGISTLCKTCENRARKEYDAKHLIDMEDVLDTTEETELETVE